MRFRLDEQKRLGEFKHRRERGPEGRTYLALIIKTLTIDQT